jgi:UDP-N-acetylmuramate-alanine ligase
MVVEADEYDRSFLKLNPSIAILTTLEEEHLDIYGSLEDLKTAFIEFANKVPFYGFVALCLDEPTLQEILPEIQRKVITYGFLVAGRRAGSGPRAEGAAQQLHRRRKRTTSSAPFRCRSPASTTCRTHSQRSQ